MQSDDRLEMAIEAGHGGGLVPILAIPGPRQRNLLNDLLKADVVATDAVPMKHIEYLREELYCL